MTPLWRRTLALVDLPDGQFADRAVQPSCEKYFASPGAIAPRECKDVRNRHCEERKRRRNPFFLYEVRLFASRSLSSGARSRDPLARNDGVRTSYVLAV